MDEIIKYYTTHKFVLSVIFRKDFIEKTLREPDENDDDFFNLQSLDYVDTIMQGEEPNYVLSENRKMLVREYIINYIFKYKQDKSKEPIVEKCNNILHNLGASNFKLVYKKMVKKFSQKKPCVAYENELIVKQYAYLCTLCSDNQLPSSVFEDAMCLKAIHIFIEECPILLHNPIFLLNVQEIISKGKHDRDVTNLLLKVRESIEQMEKEREEITKLCQRHCITALIFTEAKDFNKVLNYMLEEGRERNFFSSENFEIFQEVVLKGLNDCIFDQEKRENIRWLLMHYEGQSSDVVNEIKRKLNQPEDELWKQKNDEFYVHMAELHSGSARFLKKYHKKIQRDAALTEVGKSIIDRTVCSDISILNVIFSDIRDVYELYDNPDIIPGIYYLINAYSEIVKNPIYKDKMMNILDEIEFNGNPANFIVCLNAKKMIKTKCK